MEADLEVLVQDEGALVRDRSAIVLLALGGALVDTSFGVIGHTLLEEVGLALERDHVHEVEGVGGVINLLVTKSNKQTISDKLDVLAHELGVHADQGARESI